MSLCQGLLVVDVEGDATDHQSGAYNGNLAQNRYKTILGERSRNRWNPNEIPASRLACPMVRRSPCRCFCRTRHSRFSRRWTGGQTTDQKAGGSNPPGRASLGRRRAISSAEDSVPWALGQPRLLRSVRRLGGWLLRWRAAQSEAMVMALPPTAPPRRSASRWTPPRSPSLSGPCQGVGGSEVVLLPRRPPFLLSDLSLWWAGEAPGLLPLVPPPEWGPDHYALRQGRRRAAAEIDREQWGLNWNVALESGGVLVNKKIQIEIEADLVAAPAAA